MTSQAATDKFQACFELFKTEAYDDEEIPKSCILHSAFNSGNELQHNCLGCNFADSTDLVFNFLNQKNKEWNVQHDVTLYILLLYLFVERAEVLFKIIELPETYRNKHFKVFQQIRKWANFIKHPKSFILTHHPEYDIENLNLFNEKDFEIILNDSFIEKYYKGYTDQSKQQAINKDLYAQLKNRSSILVVFPDIEALTKKFCYSYNHFVQIICRNEIYIELLHDESTISNYFENEAE